MQKAAQIDSSMVALMQDEMVKNLTEEREPRFNIHGERAFKPGRLNQGRAGQYCLIHRQLLLTKRATFTFPFVCLLQMLLLVLFITLDLHNLVCVFS